MNNTIHKGRFSYVLTLDERVDPRFLVDHMARHDYYNTHLVSVTDLQSNVRIVGYAFRRKQTVSVAHTVVKRSFWRDIAQELLREIKWFF